jgi:hypothetical protein
MLSHRDIRGIPTIVSLLFLAGVRSAGAAAGAIDPRLAAECFSLARAASENDGGRLWGLPLYGPMLFVDRATREVAANQADGEDRLRKSGEVFVGTLPEQVSPANTAIEWAGERWTMVLWPLRGDATDQRALLLHELFHRIQPQLGHPGASPPNAHLDELNGRLWLRLEMRALTAALRATGAARRDALADALSFRQRRHELSGPRAAADEDALEMNEGLAEYTGIRLSGLSPEAMAERAAKALEREERAAGFARSFAYATGPAYALLCDELDPSWRERIARAPQLANATALGVEQAHSPEAADERSRRYDRESVERAERERHERRQQRLAEFRRRYVDGPALMLTPDAEFNFSFDPGAVESFPEFGQVYPTMRVTDRWGILAVEAAGALLCRDAKGLITAIRVPAPADAAARPVSGDGWTLTLNDGWALIAGERSGDYVVTSRK